MPENKKLPPAKRVVLKGTTQLVQGVESKIYSVRGMRVMFSHDLADLYGIETKVLLQAVRRNLDRFPEDFQFSLTNQEFTILRSQTVTSKLPGEETRGGLRYSPIAFTEQGVAMLSSVLRSPEAIAVNIQIMRTFVRLRSILAEHEDLKRQLATLERKYDGHFKAVFDAINELMTQPKSTDYQSSKVGFVKEKSKK